MKKIGVGVVGTGVISGIYLTNMLNEFKDVIEVVGVCDLIREKAEKVAEEFKIKKIYKDMYELFADSKVDIVLNITRPYEHFGVSIEALKAGKHVYFEKPLGCTLEEGEKLVALATEKKLLLGGAPDTFLGAGIQTARKLIDDGYIGDVIGASAYMVCRGHESWHEAPEFYYQFGGGPMMDMGPYYLTALINLMGGVEKVTGMTKKTFAQRTITSQPLYGRVFDVDVPTYVMGIMQFESGAIGNIFTTFDVYHATTPWIEVYGSKGTLFVPDPNTFEGPVKLFRPSTGEYKEIPLLAEYKENSRSLGIADMAKAIQEKRIPRITQEQTLHVLEIMTAFEESSQQEKHIKIKSKYKRQIPMDGKIK